MANKRKFTGVLAIMLVFGMLAAGCGNDDSENNTDQKGITITGLNGMTGGAGIGLYSQNGFIAYGEGTIKNNSVFFELFEIINNEDSYDEDYEPETKPWAGNGSYHLILHLHKQEESYFYTDGKTFIELNLIEGITFEQFLSRLPKYDFTSASSSIPFNKFKESQEWMDFDDDSSGNEITITGINDKTGDLGGIRVFSQSELIALGTGYINNNSIIFDLEKFDINSSPWIEKGPFCLEIYFVIAEKYYYYTDGKTFDELDITEGTTYEQLFFKLPKYNITSKSSTIPFNKFKEMPEWLEW